MPMMLVEDNHEWAKRHSKTGEPTVVGNKLIFPDGATCSPGCADVRSEPPENPFQRLTLQQNYNREILSRAVTDFNQLRHCLLGHGTMHASTFRTSGAPVPGDQTGIETLEFLRGRVKKIRAKLAEIDRELAETFEFQKIQHREKIRNEIEETRERQAANVRAQATAITLDD